MAISVRLSVFFIHFAAIAITGISLRAVYAGTAAQTGNNARQISAQTAVCPQTEGIACQHHKIYGVIFYYAEHSGFFCVLSGLRCFCLGHRPDKQQHTACGCYEAGCQYQRVEKVYCRAHHQGGNCPGSTAQPSCQTKVYIPALLHIVTGYNLRK